MKKTAFITMLTVLGTIFLFADLEVNIPFDQNIVGPSYAEQGDYEYQTDWITLTHTGTGTRTYHFMYSYENLPEGWWMSVCTPLTCFMPNFPTPIELEPGEVEQIHIVINVTSTNGYSFSFDISDGDLPSPLHYDFTFRTADFTEAAENEIITENFPQLRNFPNPFKSGSITNIFYNLSDKNTENAKLEIFNIKGQLIEEFSLPPNQSSIQWNGKNKNGIPVTSGTYFYKLSNGKTNLIEKMIIIK